MKQAQDGAERRIADREARESGYRGMHNGTVRGKGFEASRRNRKSHAERRANIIARSGGK